MRNNFFWSHTLLKAIAGGYGRLYNWPCSQLQTKVKYGYLYNKWAVFDSRNIASSGASIPTDTQWMALANTLGGEEVAGGKLKESGFLHWMSPNTGATNETGFNARGSGYRSTNGTFLYLTKYASFWNTIDGYWASGDRVISESYGSFGRGSNWENDRFGYSVRLIVNTPIEINGNSAIYVGNDLRRYKCCLINGIWYLAENLAETKYRNGDLIEIETDNTLWASATTGKRCSYGNIESNAFEIVSIAPLNWKIPDNDDWYYLGVSLGGYGVGGGKMKETQFLYWAEPNTGATNELGFNGRGTGYREVDGNFVGLKAMSCLMGSTTYWENANAFHAMQLDSNSDHCYTGNLFDKKRGMPIRFLMIDTSGWVVGDTVTDKEGNIYRTTKIGNQVWTADYCKCTKLNDGTPIPLITDNAAWAATTEMAQCIYDNNPLNL